MDEEKFYDRNFQDRVIPSKISNTINVGVFSAYAGVVLQIVVIMSGNKLGWLFSAALIAFGYGLQKRKSIICAAAIFLINIPAGLCAIRAFGPIGAVSSSLWIVALIGYIYVIAATVKVNRIKQDYLNGQNPEFFEGKDFVMNPYEDGAEEVAAALSYVSDEAESKYDFLLNRGDAPDEGSGGDSDNMNDDE